MKKLSILSCLLILSNCGLSGTAFLGPIYTGATTGSAYQTTISLGSGKLIEKVKTSIINKKPPQNKNLNQSSSQDNNNQILVTMVVDKIHVSEVQEPEPLP